MSFRMSTPEHRLDGADLVLRMRDGLLSAFVKAQAFKKIRQADIAKIIGVDRSVINRQLKGDAETSIMRVGEIASILGYRVNVEFERIDDGTGNAPGFVYSAIAHGGSIPQATETTTPRLDMQSDGTATTVKSLLIDAK